jgi:hypothetical protein
MSQTSIQKPVIQGVVSEPTISTSNHDEMGESEEPTDETNGTSGKDEDIFGEKFEIPAFLRKIRQ